jgi:hypothetical protein
MTWTPSPPPAPAWTPSTLCDFVEGPRPYGRGPYGRGTYGKNQAGWNSSPPPAVAWGPST